MVAQCLFSSELISKVKKHTRIDFLLNKRRLQEGVNTNGTHNAKTGTSSKNEADVQYVVIPTATALP